MVGFPVAHRILANAAVQLASALSPVPAQDIRHPDPRWLVDAGAPVNIIRIGDSSRGAKTTGDDPVSTAVLARSLTKELGKIGGSGHTRLQILGATDVEVGADGNIFILDDKRNEVFVFDGRGIYRYSFGRPGSRPGRFVEPRAVAVNETGQVVVGDFTRRIEWFANSGALGKVSQASVETESGIEDLCFLGGELIAHARNVRQNELMYAYDSTGRLKRRFGELYRSPNLRVNAEIARGRIACAYRERIVAHIASALPELRGYSPDGRLRWRTLIEGFRPAEILQPAGRPQSIRVTMPRAGMHRVATLAYDPRFGFVLQIASVGRGDGGGTALPDTVHTILVRATDGKASYVSSGLPLIRAIGSGIIVSSSLSTPTDLSVHRVAPSRQ